MGRRGPAPQPTPLRVLRGNAGKRGLNRREPRPEISIPSCPDWLSGEAKREWKRVAPELEELGLLTKIDRAALAAYCQAWARAVAAERVISRKGTTFKTPNGYIQQRPEVAIAQKQWALVAKFAAEFGLTPSGRSRMTVTPPRGSDDFEDFLNDD